jgi:hypothetical protein
VERQWNVALRGAFCGESEVQVQPCSLLDKAYQHSWTELSTGKVAVRVVFGWSRQGLTARGKPQRDGAETTWLVYCR